MTDPARQRAEALADAVRNIRCARTAVQAAACGEPDHDRRIALGQLHVVLLDAEAAAEEVGR